MMNSRAFNKGVKARFMAAVGIAGVEVVEEGDGGEWLGVVVGIGELDERGCIAVEGNGSLGELDGRGLIDVEGSGSLGELDERCCIDVEGSGSLGELDERCCIDVEGSGSLGELDGRG